MSTPKIVQLLNRLVEINQELDPLLREKRKVTDEIKVLAERYNPPYQSSLETAPGKRMVVSATQSVSWSSPKLRNLAEKLGASTHQLAACKSVKDSWSVRAMNALEK